MAVASFNSDDRCSDNIRCRAASHTARHQQLIMVPPTRRLVDKSASLSSKNCNKSGTQRTCCGCGIRSNERRRSQLAIKEKRRCIAGASLGSARLHSAVVVRGATSLPATFPVVARRLVLTFVQPGLAEAAGENSIRRRSATRAASCCLASIPERMIHE